MALSRSLIYLIGYRGSGKTTVAKQLADLLYWNWLDADALLEEHFGCTIRSIFAEEGDDGFRNKESQILQKISQKSNHVVATGGGIVLRQENRDILAHGYVVWLQACPEILWERINADATTGERRPNLTTGGLQEVRDILAQREHLYQQCADLVVSTEQHPPREIAAHIANHVWKTGQVERPPSV